MLIYTIFFAEYFSCLIWGFTRQTSAILPYLIFSVSKGKCFLVVSHKKDAQYHIQYIRHVDS